MATYGDWLYGASCGVLVLALILFLVEQAWGPHASAAATGRRREARQTLGVGATTTGKASRSIGEADPRPDRAVERAERVGRMGVSLTVLGTGLLAGSMALRGIAAGRAPWGNMYEYVAMLCLVGLVTWLVVLRRHPVRHLTGFVLLPVLILLFIGGTSLYVPAGPVVPALRSYWLVIHVSAAIIGSGILLVPGTASLLYLVRRPYEQGSTRLAALARHLPAAEVLDRLAYRLTIIAFPIFTFGVICGAVWAEAAWGRYWAWDPKETVAFVMWVVLAAYLHSRATAGWRTTRAAIINVVAYALGVFNLFFVNLVVTGLHSYAGI
ncbi:MAG: c-type cytochrome biogenesis protein CcsB [Pseudonocardia sp.]|nr:c-type cytochrome biogenesis protein CcsB [Pseudonocardia sp.]